MLHYEDMILLLILDFLPYKWLKETEARGAFGIVITTKDLDDFEDYTKIVVPTTSINIFFKHINPF